MSTVYTTHGCPYCGQHHDGRTCPMVKAMEYYQNGTLKRVEFHEPKPVFSGSLKDLTTQGATS